MITAFEAHRLPYHRFASNGLSTKLALRIVCSPSQERGSFYHVGHEIASNSFLISDT